MTIISKLSIIYIRFYNVNALFQIAAEEGFDYQMNRYGQNNLDNKKVSSKILELNSNGN